MGPDFRRDDKPAEITPTSKIVDLSEAAEKLEQLIERALAGEDVVIPRDGEPLVRLAPVAKRAEPRVPGRMKGRIWIAPDFDEMSEQELKGWEGR